MTAGSKSKRRQYHFGALALLGICLITISVVPRLRWRAQLIALHLTGHIPDIEFTQMLGYMLPGSDQSVVRMIQTRNPYPVIHNTKTSTSDIEAGARIFLTECARCHAPDGGGSPVGPALNRGALKHGDSDWAIYRTIRNGVLGTEMKPHKWESGDIWRVIAFLRTVSNVRDSSRPRLPPVAISVSAAELDSIQYPSRDWLTYAGSYSSARHSLLQQIAPNNVGRLALRWMYQFDGDPGLIETSPIVRNGVMFVTVPPATVLALDAVTGKLRWRFDHAVPAGLGGEFGAPLNRGVALLGDQVFIGTSDAKVIAIAAETGVVRWETAVSSEPSMYFISSAPLAYKDMVVTGVGTHGGGRGFVAALDAATGRERWRWVAIPAAGEPGNDTWAGDSWREGGAPTWMTGSYDPEFDLLIWHAGNPKPDYEPDRRKGDNLYSNSLIALRASTGEFLWHFQFTPADDHDWDANQIAVLARYPTAHGIERRVLMANRNGFYYVLDGASGHFLVGTPFVHQTWAAGLDSVGRPILAPNTARTDQGTMLYPGNVGGTNWWPPSYDPRLDLMFIPSLEQGMLYFRSASSWPVRQEGTSFYTVVRALNARTGALVWEHRNPPRTTVNATGGLLSTATGLLFGGDLGQFFALDSRTGARLWSVETGGRIHAAPVTYEAGGEQYVVIAAGGSLVTFALPAQSAGRRDGKGGGFGALPQAR